MIDREILDQWDKKFMKRFGFSIIEECRGDLDDWDEKDIEDLWQEELNREFSYKFGKGD